MFRIYEHGRLLCTGDPGEKGLWLKVGSASEPPVWVTPLATIFHREECEICGEPRSPVSRQEAVERGLTACPVCDP